MDARLLKKRLLDFWKIELQEVGKSNLWKFGNQTSGSSEIKPLEVRKSNPNYTNYNQTNYNQTEYSYTNPINLSKTEEKDDGEDG